MDCRGAILDAVIRVPYEPGQRTRLLELLFPCGKKSGELIHPTLLLNAAKEIVRKGRLDDLRIIIQRLDFHPSSIGEMLLQAVKSDRFEIASELKRSGVITQEYLDEAKALSTQTQNLQMQKLLKGTSSVCCVQ